MELHTLGVDGGYTQKDVRKSRARSQAGRSQIRGRAEASSSTRACTTTAKRSCSGTQIKAGGGEHDGEQVLDILAVASSTARFIATKLARRFVADEPPQALVDRAAERFGETKGTSARSFAQS